ADGGGNVTYMTDGSQAMVASYRYDPFGILKSSSGTLASANVYRFSSKEIHVNSGMYYYLYRFYDPNLQRWINRDPIGEQGFELLRAGPQRARRPMYAKASATPVLANLYAFVGNSPLERIDA